jgi:hypothetical protein
MFQRGLDQQRHLQVLSALRVREFTREGCETSRILTSQNKVVIIFDLPTLARALWPPTCQDKTSKQLKEKSKPTYGWQTFITRLWTIAAVTSPAL